MHTIDIKKSEIALFALMLLAVTGCAERQTQAVITPSPTEKNEVTIEAGSFNFDPNHIVLRHPGAIVLHVRNISSIGHNLTVKNLRGEVLKSVDLPPNETVRLDISLPDAGTYPIYCDKPFHSGLGMKGSIVVLPGSEG